MISELEIKNDGSKTDARASRGKKNSAKAKAKNTAGLLNLMVECDLLIWGYYNINRGGLQIAKRRDF